jgi:hypothetical protein
VIERHEAEVTTGTEVTQTIDTLLPAEPTENSEKFNYSTCYSWKVGEGF